jgi:large subunit ribosomal protein L10
MPTETKAVLVAEIKDKITGSTGIIMADYRGLSVKDMQELRSKLRESGGEVRIYKNRLTEIAMRELAMPSMGDFLEGPTAFVFTSDDPVGPAKTLMDFAKDHQALEVKGGFIENAVIGAASVKALASLPSREELVAKLMGSMLNPVRGFMSMANAPAAALARALRAVADQKAAA